MPDSSPWYQSFFGQDYLDVYGHGFSDDRAEREAAFASKALALQPGEDVLDLCCGQGRHSVPVARSGVRVTGLDLAADYLVLAQNAAREAGVPLEAVHADMRAIPFEARFDAVINMFSSFGYLESEEEDAKVLASIYRALKPGGRVLMDLINREWAVTNYVQNDWHEGADGTVYLEHREIDLPAGRNHVTFTAIAKDGSRREIVGHHIRLYTLREVIGMLQTAGLHYETVYGGFDGEPYAIGTWRMIVVATKPA
jgi:SAM-dependent methyltransferase